MNTLKQLILVTLLLILSVIVIESVFNQKNPIVNNSQYITVLDGFTPYEVANMYYLEKEIVGNRHNSVIVKFLSEFAISIADDETPWCSAFVNFTAFKAGYQYTGKLNARSWLQIGCKIEEEDTRPGDVVIFWRGKKDSWQGHVAYFVREKDDIIYVFGGNQNNRVNITGYPKEKVLGYRRLHKTNENPKYIKGGGDSLYRKFKVK